MARRLALVIGNSQYDDRGLSQLVAPAADVAALVEVLRDPAIGGFDSVEGVVNEGFARTLRAIAGFFEKRKRDDLLLLYFSGHGIRDEYGHLHLAVRDTERELLAATAVGSAFITGCMDRSASKRLVLVLDCCHSGAFGYGAKSAEGASVGTAAAFGGTGRGRVVLTATDSTQYAWQGESVIGSAGPSVFTRHLTDGLKTGAADLNNDGLVTLDELYDYVYEQVLNDTSKQTPGKWVFGQQGEIVIAKSGVAATGAVIAGSAETSAATASPTLTERLVAAAVWLRRDPLRIGASAAAILLVALFLVRGPNVPPSTENIPVPSATPAPDLEAPLAPAANETATEAAPPQETAPSRGRAQDAVPTNVATTPPPPSSPARLPETTVAAATGPRRPAPRPPAAVETTVRVTETPPPSEVLDDRRAARPASPAPAERPATPQPGGDPAPTRPAPTPAPPVAAPAAVPSAAALVKNTIAEYERAAEALDEPGVRRVWPGAPDGLRISYRNLTSQTVELECSEPAVSGDTATVGCLERIRSVGAGRIALPVATNDATFSLQRNGDEWQIVRIARRPR